MFPDIVKLGLQGISDAGDKYRDLDYYGQLYEIDLSALKEPSRKKIRLVEVNPKKVMTNAFELKTFNLQTEKKENIAVDIDFSLTTSRNSVVNVLVTFFDVIFSNCHKEVNKHVINDKTHITFLSSR